MNSPVSEDESREMESQNSGVISFSTNHFHIILLSDQYEPDGVLHTQVRKILRHESWAQEGHILYTSNPHTDKHL